MCVKLALQPALQEILSHVTADIFTPFCRDFFTDLGTLRLLSVTDSYQCEITS